MYRHISVDVERAFDENGSKSERRTRWSIGKGIAKFFQPEQRQLKCEKCDVGTTATQTLQILSRPKALLVQAKRFVYVKKPLKRSNRADSGEDTGNNVDGEGPPTRMVLQKIKDPIIMDETVTLGSFMENPGDEDYEIQSIIHHLGSTASSGHYTADALRHKDGKDCWVSFDDGITSTIKAQSVLLSEVKQRSAYVALYRLRGA